MAKNEQMGCQVSGSGRTLGHMVGAERGGPQGRIRTLGLKTCTTTLGKRHLFGNNLGKSIILLSIRDKINFTY